MAYEFPRDHVLETVRGAKRLKPREVRRALANRCVWLERKIAEIKNSKDGPRGSLSYHVDELKAILQVQEAWETFHPQRDH